MAETESWSVDNLDALQSEICAWRHNRLLYPGWLVAPKQTRERIWSTTENWLSVAYTASTKWQSHHLLILWREICWRLNLCLQIIPSDAARIIEGVVSELHWSVENEIDSPTELFQKDDRWPNELIPSKSEFGRAWLDCRLALLENYRFRPDFAAFERTVVELSEIPFLQEDDQCLIAYQSCLLALSETDGEAAREQVLKWPSDPEDPYWLVRKASIQLELEAGDEAWATALRALERIRAGRLSETSRFWGLSREGWCLRFLFQLQEARKFRSRDLATTDEASEVSSQRKQIDRELEIARCSPEVELQYLRERIDGRDPPTRYPSRVYNIPSFDSGESSVSFRVGGDQTEERLAPAINLLRLIEVTGVPSSSLRLGFFLQETKIALAWIRADLPGLWAAFALRFEGIGIGQDRDAPSADRPDAIRRVTLEALPLPHIERLFYAAMVELQRIVSLASRVGTTENSQRGFDRYWFAFRLADAVSRLSMCLDDEEREMVLNIAITASNRPALRRHPLSRQMVVQLLGRTIPFLTRDQLSSYVIELLTEIPVPSEADTEHTWWPDVALIVQHVKVLAIARPQSEEMNNAVSSLLDLASSNDLVERSSALARLSYLRDWNILTVAEGQAFNDRLWKNLDEFGLPRVESNVLMHTLLEWGSDRENETIVALRKWIARTSVAKRYSTSDEKDASGNPTITTPWPDPDSYLDNLLGLAHRYRDRPELQMQLFGDSSADHILQSIFKWWDSEKETFRRDHARPNHMLGGDTFERVGMALRVILNCALGYTTLNGDKLGQLNEFLQEISEIRDSDPFSLPIKSYLSRDRYSENWERLRVALWNPDPSIANGSLCASWEWQRSARRLDLQVMPNGVFEAIVSSMESLNSPISPLSFTFVGDLVRTKCLPNPEADTPRLSAAAESLALRLGYPPTESVEENSFAVDPELRSHFRRNLAILLGELNEHEIAIGPLANDWLEQAKHDRFIDVRRNAERVSTN